MQPTYRAIIVGGTGAVGSAIVRALVASPRCTGVVALVRRPTTQFDDVPGRAKLDVATIDFAALEREAAARGVGCDVAFCTVGIGQPRKVSAEEFHRVDVEYAGAFARGVASAGVRHLSLLSAIGSDATSRNRYVRTKGEAEAAVLAGRVRRTSIFRPSVLATDGIRYGLQDRLTQSLFPLVSPLLPSKWHQIHVDALGRAMARNAERDGDGVEYLYYADFRRLLDDAT